MFQHWEWNCHFDGAHGVWSDVGYIVVERDALSAEGEILCRGDVACRSISHVFQSFVSGHFVVSHELVPDQVGQWLFIISYKKIIQAEGTHHGKVQGLYLIHF